LFWVTCIVGNLFLKKAYYFTISYIKTDTYNYLDSGHLRPITLQKVNIPTGINVADQRFQGTCHACELPV